MGIYMYSFRIGKNNNDFGEYSSFQVQENFEEMTLLDKKPIYIEHMDETPSSQDDKPATDTNFMEKINKFISNMTSTEPKIPENATTNAPTNAPTKAPTKAPTTQTQENFDGLTSATDVSTELAVDVRQQNDQMEQKNEKAEEARDK